MEQYQEYSNEGIKFTQEYRGNYVDGKKDGKGSIKFSKTNCLQKYFGRFDSDNYHGEGIYTKEKENESYMYEGTFYMNKFEGYGRIILESCIYFEGLFKDNRRFGPGVQTYEDGTQDVGLWHGLDLLRLCQVILPEYIPKLANTPTGKLNLTKFKAAIPLCKENNFNDETFEKTIYNRSNRNTESVFFDKPYFDKQFFGKIDYFIEVPMENQNLEISQGTNEEKSSEIATYAIEEVIKNIKRLRECTVKELELIKLKFNILRTLASDKINTNNLKTKKILVTDLLAWNNGEFCRNVLKHCFKHRYKEHLVNFSIPKLLMGQRECFGKPGIYESACRAFLRSCSEGNAENATQLLRKFRINPDITDASGNCGVFFASARDWYPVIRILTNFGSNIDLENDEGLNSLNMCLLRYISLQKNFKNWEQAFLNNEVPEKNEKNVENYSPNTLFLSQITNSFVQNEKLDSEFLLEEHPELNFNHKPDFSAKCKNLRGLFQEIGTITSKDSILENFQNSFECSESSQQDNIFKTEFRAKKKGAKIKTKSKKEKEPKLEECNQKLETELKAIFNTVSLLLYLGADPNINFVPVPSIVIGLYTESPEIMTKLLEAGADLSRKFSEDNLNLLHLLCSMPSSEKLPLMAKLLLTKGLDPNCRCGPDHWVAERKNILGDYKGEVEDPGKTPLQILASRVDFEEDQQGFLCEIAKIIVEFSNESLTEQYLGHNVLSLAILRGNIKLMEQLLKSGADPNSELVLGLGCPLSVFILKRYKSKMPSIDIQCAILDLLVEYLANPLNSVQNFGNVLEFMNFDNSEPPKNEKASKKDKNKNKKLEKNSKKNEKSSKNSKKSRKSDKKSHNGNIKAYLKNKLRQVLHCHHQGNALLILLRFLAGAALEYSKSQAQFLSVDDALRIFQKFIDNQIINLRDNLHVAMMLTLIEFLNAYGIKEKKKKTKGKKIDFNAMELIKTLHDPQPKKLNCKTKEFEVDFDESKYKVCAFCGLKTGKLLISCPKCGLVQYCSNKCNHSDRNNRMMHPCKLNFYNDELLLLKDPDYVNPWQKIITSDLEKVPIYNEMGELEPNIVFFARILENPFVDRNDGIKEFIKLPESSIKNAADFFANLGLSNMIGYLELALKKVTQTNSLIFGKTSKAKLQRNSSEFKHENIMEKSHSQVNTRKEQQIATAVNTIKNIHSAENSKENFKKLINKTHSSEKFDESYESSSLQEINKSIQNLKNKVDSSKLTKNINQNFTTDMKLDKTNAMNLEFLRFHNSDKFRPLPADLIELQREKLLSKSSNGHIKSSCSRSRNVKATGIIKSRGSQTEERRATKSNHAFMEILQKLFPEFDCSAALMPFACLVNGDLYYRFSDSKPLYFNTHL